MSKQYILEQVNMIIKKLLKISSDTSIITIADDSFCFEQDKQQYFEHLLKELKNKNIDFKQICIDKIFCDKTIEEKQSFLLEKKDDGTTIIKVLSPKFD